MTKFTHLDFSLVRSVVETKALRGVRTGLDWVRHRVGANGVLGAAWQQISIGRHRAGRNADVQLSKEI